MHKELDRPESQDALVARLCAEKVLTSAAADAMRQVDRAFFVPPLGFASVDAYMDRAQAMGFNTTVSAPRLHAQALSFLEPALPIGGEALDLGCGTGYVAACLAVLAGETGRARGLDHLPEIVEMAHQSLTMAGLEPLIERGQLRISCEDARSVPDIGTRRYDAIYCGAAAPEDFCTRLAETSLKPGGRLVIAVDNGSDGPQVLRGYEKDAEGFVTFQTWKAVMQNVVHYNYPSGTYMRDRFDPLRDAEAQMQRTDSAVCAVM